MKGSYVLISNLKKDSKIKIGKLGVFNFQKGYYCYIGSALGKSVNLENRTNRHIKLNKEKSGNIHWHIDYFLVNPDVEIVEIKKIESQEGMECEISNNFQEASDNSIVGFGCSDCNCKSHFYYFKDKSYQEVLENVCDKL